MGSRSRSSFSRYGILCRALPRHRQRVRPGNGQQRAEKRCRTADPAIYAAALERLAETYQNLGRQEKAVGAAGDWDRGALNVRVVSNNLFHQGLDILTNYTWSHIIDNGNSSDAAPALGSIA